MHPKILSRQKVKNLFTLQVERYQHAKVRHKHPTIIAISFLYHEQLILDFDEPNYLIQDNREGKSPSTRKQILAVQIQSTKIYLNRAGRLLQHIKMFHCFENQDCCFSHDYFRNQDCYFKPCVLFIENVHPHYKRFLKYRCRPTQAQRDRRDAPSHKRGLVFNYERMVNTPTPVPHTPISKFLLLHSKYHTLKVQIISFLYYIEAPPVFMGLRGRFSFTLRY